MDIKDIPVIIPVYNQLTYLRNMLNWLRWYLPENPIWIIDNGSTYESLVDFLREETWPWYRAYVYKYINNDFIGNLSEIIRVKDPKYYVISDPDIMPHPATPVTFMEQFMYAIEMLGYHRAGFGLITDDLPDYLSEREMIIGNEKELIGEPVIEIKGYPGYRAPLDTTFCLYKRDNGGWSCPMDGKNWGNCLRIFKSFHLSWYLDPDNINEEMDYYFKHAKYRVPGQPSSGSCNNMPDRYKPKEV